MESTQQKFQLRWNGRDDFVHGEVGNVRGDVGCARSSVVHSSGSAPRHRDGEEEDTVEGVAVPEGETVRDLQDQKTHVQSSEALAYLARFLFSFASLRRFSIS